MVLWRLQGEGLGGKSECGAWGGADAPCLTTFLGLLPAMPSCCPLVHGQSWESRRGFLRLLGDRPRAESPRCPHRVTVHPLVHAGLGRSVGVTAPKLSSESPKNQTCSGSPSSLNPAKE